MGSSMTALLILEVTALCTCLTRAVPFLFFGGKKLLRPGFYFSAEYFHILVIYCLRNITPTASPFGIPEIIAVLTAAGLQKYKHNNLLSILCSTVLYMIMVQTIFSA